MSLKSPRRLDATLFLHFEGAKHLLGGSIESFTESMIEVNDTLPSSLRTSIFSRDESAVKRMETNGKRMRRYADENHDQRMPAELAADVCRLVGSMYVPVPEAAGGADMANIGAVMKEFGEFCIAFAPVGADGRIDASDLPHLDEAIRQCEELIAAATAARAQLGMVREQAKVAP